VLIHTCDHVSRTRRLFLQSCPKRGDDMWAEGSASRGYLCLCWRDRRGWTVGNNVAHYSEALEWPVADRRVFCRIPVAPSTNIGGGKRVLCSSLLLLDYPWVRLSHDSFRSSPSGWRGFHSLDDVLRAALRIQRNLQRNLYVAPVYVVPVRGESDVLTIPGCAGLTSAAYESESIRHLRTILLRMT